MKPGLVLAAILLVCCAERPAPRRPNILFVSIDTLRADHCSLYGYERPTTPQLEALARDGVVCERAYAPMPTTLPSHATMFTGLLPRRHGVLKNGILLGDEHETLAERLSEHGYRTAAVVSSVVVNHESGIAQGFADYRDRFPSTTQITKRGRPRQVVSWSKRADVTSGEALEWLASRGYLSGPKPAQPFFLWVHFYDPHAPYDPPPPYRDRFLPTGADEQQATLAAYDGEIALADEGVGSIVAALRTAGQLDATLVIVAADHGEGLMSHGYLGHGPQLYEEAVRVPLVLRWPRSLPRAARVDAPISLADLRPTVLELAGIPDAAASGDGASLVATLQGRQRGNPQRPIFLQRRDYDEQEKGGDRYQGTLLGLLQGRLKYLEAPEEDRLELYDLDADPGELRNLLPAASARAAPVVRMLAAWRESPRVARGREDLRPEAQEGLRALGYVR